MRKTYIDNNGFVRYEDNGKIAVNGNHFYTDHAIANELSTWKRSTMQGCSVGDYEEKILAMQEGMLVD